MFFSNLLAAGIAAITVGFRLVFFLMDGNILEAWLAAIFVAVMLGFLVHNWHPASIFMGDAGSLFMGCYVAGLTLIGGWPYSRGIASVLVFPVLILLVPIFDTMFVAVTRRLAGRPISTGGRDHTSHRLVALGLPAKKAVLFFYGVATLSGFVALFSYQYRLSYSVVSIAFLGIGLAILAAYVGRMRVDPDTRSTEVPSGRIVQFVLDLTYRRQIATVVLDFVLIVLAYYTAYLLRFESETDLYSPRFLESLPVVVTCQLLSLAALQTYQGVWRYTGLSDLLRLFRAALLGVAVSVLAIVYAYQFEGYRAGVHR